VLEVLAGVRSPEEAAAALALPLASYFQLEERALRGLVAGCGPQPRGRAPDTLRALEESKRRIGELEREVQRHQALLRGAQRSAGLVGTPAGTARSATASRAAGTARAAGATKSQRPSGRRPKVRALRAVAVLRGSGGGGGGGGDAVSVPSAPMPAVAQASDPTAHPAA
jgi:hypothetical protein